ncbi:hypothetical protein BGZ65_006973 [Modicella reniformis]|uniref:SMAD/FHA domain-containing protein n=1 Tax=Modicella reniformis TaxID=1440133 RepID=A0A9P6M8D8_9FUNG|nr:hypothetical protein BGZ65_006973 [Modicella reniformis]
MAPSAGSTSVATTTATTKPVPHIRIVPHLDAPRSLHFDVVDKDVPDGFVLKIGRFTDKQNLPNRVTFKSKVVSRGHAEIYSENGKFFIRDTKSSSGTFLNHSRLSPPGVESKPTPLKDGDVIQLGVDYQGGTQEIYRCVKMRLELNRSWQQQANPFRENTLKAIRSLTTANASCATDCCICLFRIASFQSLFVAPCSHVYHYKCIRPMLIANHPGFLCPLCRTFADLEDVVEIDDPIEEQTPLHSRCHDRIQFMIMENTSIEAQSYLSIVLSTDFSFVDAVAVAEQGAREPNPIEQPSNAESTSSGQQDDHPEPATVEEISVPTQPSEWVQSDSPAHIEAETSTPSSSTPNLTSSPRPASPSASSLLSSSSAPPQSSASATVPPMDIARAGGSSLSMDSPVQQSPSAAFLMAPSPPMFVSSFGLSPIPFVAPSSNGSSSGQQSPPSQHHHQHHAPSSPSSHVGHMLQNFVRNITIPHRNRSRTNSNSASSPIATTNNTAHMAIGTQGGTATDVFGKTLVMTPPATQLSNNRAGTGHTGAGELGVVSEVEADNEHLSLQDSGHDNSHGSSSRDSGSSRSSSQSREDSSTDNLALHNAQTITTGAIA